MEKDFLTLIGIFFTAASYGVYIYSIFKRTTRPHPFSWLIWGLLTAIAFFAQLSDGAGAAAWITGFSAALTLFIALLGYLKRHDITISKSDAVMFILSLLAIPLWIITDTPLWSVLMITLIDTAGFYPTFRKSWHRPDQEPILSMTLTVFKHLFTLLALNHYSLITALFPATLLGMNSLFILLLFYRRWALR